ncbi:hypothetical protein ILUMI_22488 [Ignelater luminosus]|uniref:F-box/LRR-repeat protein 15-like leucin rich repeat domain-containing protein n=1 Tax=Ignelater luminosus TaxID=2038154 RepID=A0A8K0CAJ3_IGNLU|nr:hypothetical protein ILUMI_22488 [Ignelater luminosus]
MPFSERRVDSLISLSMKYIMDHLEKYAWDFDTVTVFPTNVKHSMLRKFMSSMYYWRNINFKKVLKVLLIPSLKRIDLTLATVDDEILEILTVCHDLREVYLTREKNNSITSEGLINFISTLKHLNLIQMSNCDGVNDDVITCLAETCQSLSALDVNGCKNVSDEGIERLSDLENIQWLSLSSTQVTNDGIKKLVNGASGANIKELRLANCKNITSEILDIITRHCPSIQVLVFYTMNPCEHRQSTHFSLEEPNLKNLKQLTWTVRW